MKKIFLLLCLTSFLSVTFIHDTQAQSRKKKSSRTDEYFDESGNFLSKVWYAGGVQLNFGTFILNSGARGNSFVFGLSPMAGYEFFEGFSVGPRIEFAYQNAKIDNFGQDLSFNSFDYGIGIFSRYRFPNGIFIHGEYQSFSQEVSTGAIIGDRLQTSRQIRDNTFIGAGFSSALGNLWGYEISILYNVAEERTADYLPIVYRFGINYKFN